MKLKDLFTHKYPESRNDANNNNNTVITFFILKTIKLKKKKKRENQNYKISLGVITEILGNDQVKKSLT